MFDDYEYICTVCHQPLGLSPAEFGKRTYCEAHFELLVENRPGIWRAIVNQAVAMPLLLITILVLTQVLGWQPEGGTRLLASLVLAVLPGLLWLTAIVWQEWRSGGNVQYLLTVPTLGALLASAVATPFLLQVADIDLWLPASPLVTRFLGNVLLVGPTNIILIYVVVRYTVLQTTAFERRADGILYCVATAVGYATMLNIQFASAGNGFAISSGIFRVIANVMGHAGAAAVLGYFIGMQRFESLPIPFLPIGLVLAAFIDGLFVYSRTEINRISLSATQDAFSPWPGLAFSFLMAGLSFVAIYQLLVRANKTSKARMLTSELDFVQNEGHSKLD